MANMGNIIQELRSAIDSAEGNVEYRSRLSYELSVQLGENFLRTGSTTDIGEAVQVINAVVKVTPEDHLNYPDYVNCLLVQLERKYQTPIGDSGDAYRGIQIGRKLVQNTPISNPQRLLYLHNFGNILEAEYTLNGDLKYLEEAISAAEEAVSSTPEGHPHRPIILRSLGNLLSKKYSRTGTIQHLEAAISLGRKSVDITPECRAYHPAMLISLANRLNRRYERNGDIGDLQEAIELERKAIRNTPENSPDRLAYLGNLGTGLENRYLRMGALADLDEAILVSQAVVRTASKDHRWFLHAGHLSVRLELRYLRTRDLGTLSESIDFAQDAVKATPQSHPGLADALNNLSSVLGNRFLATGTIADSDEAIKISHEALDATPEGHPNRAVVLNNLSAFFADRFSELKALGHLEDAMGCLKEAIMFAQRALETISKDHPQRAMFQNNLGRMIGNRFKMQSDIADFHNSTSCYRSALEHLNAPPSLRIRAGIQALRMFADAQMWDTAYDIAQSVMSLAPKLAIRSLPYSDKQHLLSEIAGFSADAAAIALHASKDLTVAMGFLEQTRGIVATSLQELRTDTSKLPQDLAEQFARLKDELERPAIRQSLFSDENAWSSHPLPSFQYNLSEELDRLILEIRNKTEFGDFLLPPERKSLQAAAQYGPIVVINVSEYRCDAILVQKNQITSLPLSSLKKEEVEAIARGGSQRLGSPTTLSFLWDVIAKPVLDALMFTESPNVLNDKWPRVWWITTGSLSRFPIHAAGYHRKDSTDAVIDRVVSSYSSSIKAIIHSRRVRSGQVTPTSTSQAVLVGMAHTPGQKELRFASQEVKMLREIFTSMKLEPVEPKRRTSDVLMHLRGCKVFHFAGHGYTNPVDPSQSSLLLEDWETEPLTVARLLDISIGQSQPFLAYLSACGTGQIINGKFFDESIHLISAYQLAGFRHVIGTLWDVEDKSCIDMAELTYSLMRDQKMSDESVSLGLQFAARALRHNSLNTPKPKVKLEEKGITHAEDKSMDPRDGSLDLKKKANEKWLRADWIPYVHYGP